MGGEARVGDAGGHKKKTGGGEAATGDENPWLSIYFHRCLAIEYLITHT